MCSCTKSSTFRKLWASGVTPSALYVGLTSHSWLSGRLNSGDTMSSTLPRPVANETSVGGTSRSSNEPDMESLPPMEPMPRSSWAMRAPSTAAVGLPQRSGTSRSFSKYSWNVRYMALRSMPAAASFATDSTTERYAPVNWFSLMR